MFFVNQDDSFDALLNIWNKLIYKQAFYWMLKKFNSEHKKPREEFPERKSNFQNLRKKSN